jgi:pimeloyl-ACP methyl ester carboxylesterase
MDTIGLQRSAIGDYFPPGYVDADRRGFCVAGAGVPVVLLHASLSSKSQWRELAAQLAPRFRVIAIDLCGYGDNPMPAARESFSVDDEVALVLDHIDQIAGPRSRVHLVGHSFGAFVALRLASRHSERVASLALYEPVAFRMLEADDPALAEMHWRAEIIRNLVAAGSRQAAAAAFIDFWSGKRSFASLPPKAQAGAARGIDKVLMDFDAARRWKPDASDLTAITAPVLLLSGKHSPAVVQRIFALLVRAFPGSHVARFDIGHMGPMTDPATVNPWIEAFVDLYSDPQQGESTFEVAEAAPAGAD